MVRSQRLVKFEVKPQRLKAGQGSVQSLGYETEITLLNASKKGDLLVNGNLNVPGDDNCKSCGAISPKNPTNEPTIVTLSSVI